MKALVELILENTRLKRELVNARNKIRTAAMVIDSALNAGPIRREEATQGVYILWELFNHLKSFRVALDRELVVGWQARMEQDPMGGLPLPKIKRRVLSMAFTRHPFSKPVDVRPKI